MIVSPRLAALAGPALRLASAPAPVRSLASSPVTRSARPRIPEDFFSMQAQALLVNLLAQRAASWQRQGEPPIYFYGCRSMLRWGAEARQRWEGRSLRRATGWRLREELSVDLERGLRLLTMKRTAEGHTLEGHKAREWEEALAGVLWRVGQVYRELARREGEERAQGILRLAVSALWQ